MSNSFVRNLKLAMSISLVCLWAAASIGRVPFLGDGVFILLVATYLQYPARVWVEPLRWKPRQAITGLLFVLSLIAFGWLISHAFSQEEFELIWHSPLFVVLVSTLWVLLIVRLSIQSSQAAPNYSSKPTC